MLFALAHRIVNAPVLASENYIDGLIYQALSWPALFAITQDQRNYWSPVFEKVILNLSDQMLLTGLAMLISGFSLHCEISVYHITIVSDLVWFSSNVHLTTLTVLIPYLRKRPVLRNWRIALMSCMAGFLITITWWQGHFAWYESYAFPAQCVWNDMYGYPDAIGGRPKYWMVTDLSLIAVFYSLAIINMFVTPVEFLNEWLYSKPKGLLESEINKTPDQIPHPPGRTINFERLSHTLSFKPWMILYVLYLGIAWLIITISNSTGMNYAVDLFWFAYSLYFLIEDREIPSRNGGAIDGDEDVMGFGQIVPLLLLSSTVLVFVEAYFGK